MARRRLAVAVGAPADQTWRVTARVVVVVVVVALLLGCGGDARKSRPQAKVVTEGIAAGELVDVGGRRLYVECTGSARPTVVLEAGLGGNSDSWSGVLPQLGRTTRTCAYDRAGLSASDAIAGVHDARDEISDLERLLDRARIKPPYVLVGHSYGGLLARLFARAHPDQVAGVVFVDAMGRDATRRQLAIWPKSEAPAQRREWAKPVQDHGVDLERGEALASRMRRWVTSRWWSSPGLRPGPTSGSYHGVFVARKTGYGGRCRPSSRACRPTTFMSSRFAAITL